MRKSQEKCVILKKWSNPCLGGQILWIQSLWIHLLVSGILSSGSSGIISGSVLLVKLLIRILVVTINILYIHKIQYFTVPNLDFIIFVKNTLFPWLLRILRYIGRISGIVSRIISGMISGSIILMSGRISGRISGIISGISSGSINIVNVCMYIYMYIYIYIYIYTCMLDGAIRTALQVMPIFGTSLSLWSSGCWGANAVHAPIRDSSKNLNPMESIGITGINRNTIRDL
jgi:hypothetical protein